MSHIVIMPKLGLTMTHGQVVRWLKNENDPVKKGEPLVEVETDKISYEVESPADGYLLKILAGNGEDRNIVEPIGVVGERGEEAGIPGAPGFVKAEGTPVKVLISPVARKLAEENGFDYSGIKGTGPEGRIVKEDIQAAIQSMEISKNNQMPAAAPETSCSAVSQEIPVLLQAVDFSGRKTPLAGIRKVIADRLSQSKHDIPHVYFRTSVDVSSLIEFKNRIAEPIKIRTGKNPTLNDMIVKAVAAAIEEYPEINVSLIGGEILYHGDINIGIAVNAESGLIVPVIKGANQKSLMQICVHSGELIEKAKNRKLSQEDINGGTFTVSNLGAYGIEEFSAIINPPESAILAVGMAKDTPCAENGSVVIKPVMNLTLSVDHRVIDGVLAARFLKKLKKLLEDPYSFLL